MSGDKNEPSATSVERARRKLMAAQEGARSMAEFEKEAIAVRKNMDRLRALRLAREAAQPQSAASAKTAARTSAVSASSSTTAPSAKSTARRTLPSILALKTQAGSGSAAPWAKVSFTAFL